MVLSLGLLLSAGFSSNIIESSLCTECVPGKFTNGVHSTNCIDCPNGLYADNTASSECKKCDNGTYSVTQGSPSRENCLHCPNGKISEAGSETCEFCPVGKWSNEKIICEGEGNGPVNALDNAIRNNIDNLDVTIDVLLDVLSNFGPRRAGGVLSFKSNNAFVFTASADWEQWSAAIDPKPGRIIRPAGRQAWSRRRKPRPTP